MYSSIARQRAVGLLPAFDGEGVRILDVVSASHNAFSPPTGPLDDAIYVVQGGTAMVEGTGAPPALLDPAHVLLVHAPEGTRIRLLSAGARCTMLVIAREHASPVTSVRDHSRPAPSVLSLDANALFRFFWLRHALTNTRFRSVEIARSARAIHKEALAGARALSGPDVSNVRSRTARRALADGARARLAASVDMAHPLVEVARSLHASPFHLAHVFREEVGLSLHQYLVRLRLIAALDDLSAGATDLSRLALELGFSNHSHFSVTFRRAFGVSPSEARRRLTAASLPTDGQAWQPGVGARADSA